MLFLEDCVPGKVYICYHKLEDHIYLHRYLGDDQWSVGRHLHQDDLYWDKEAHKVARTFNSNDKVIPLYLAPTLSPGQIRDIQQILHNLPLVELDSLQAAKTYFKVMGLSTPPAEDTITTFSNNPNLRHSYLYRTLLPELKIKVVAKLTVTFTGEVAPNSPKVKVTKKYKIINCAKDKNLFRELEQ